MSKTASAICVKNYITTRQYKTRPIHQLGHIFCKLWTYIYIAIGHIYFHFGFFFLIFGHTYQKFNVYIDIWTFWAYRQVYIASCYTFLCTWQAFQLSCNGFFLDFERLWGSCSLKWFFCWLWYSTPLRITRLNTPVLATSPKTSFSSSLSEQTRFLLYTIQWACNESLKADFCAHSPCSKNDIKHIGNNCQKRSSHCNCI